MSTATQDAWVKIGVAMEILGIGEMAVRRLVAEGRLTTRQVPGCRLRLRQSELERLAAEFTIPAGQALSA